MSTQPDSTPPDPDPTSQEWLEVMGQPVPEGVWDASQDPTIDGSIEPRRAAGGVDK